MISPENLVLTAISTALKASYPTINISSEEMQDSATFPAFSIEESDNHTNINLATNKQAHVNLMYTLNAYSDKESGKKTEAKNMMAIADSVMQGFGFVCTSNSPTPNIDNSIARRTARYTGIAKQNAANDFTIYR